MLWSRKGVSPLIATVLLLAFAVSLATVIMQLDIFGKCKLKGVDIEVLDGIERKCFHEQRKSVEIFIVNKEAAQISGFQIVASGMTGVLNIDNLPVELMQNEKKKISFEYDPDEYGRLMSLEIYPLKNSSRGVETCEMAQSKVQLPLPSCT